MLKAFDILVRPSQAQLEKTLGIKHIKVDFLDEYWDVDVPVTVNYRLPSGKKRLMSARYIRELKMMGVLSR